MRYFKFILLAFFFIACKNFSTYIQPVTYREPLSSTDPVHVFSMKDNELPDSAIYIGTFTSYFNASNAAFTGVGPNYSQLAYSLESEAQDKGANLLMIDPNAKGDNHQTLSGKAYYVNLNCQTNYTYDSLMKIWSKRTPDQLEGIYETDLAEIFNSKSNDKYIIQYAVLKIDSTNYLMVYLDGFQKIKDTYLLTIMKNVWRKGDVFAKIQTTEKPNLFKAQTYDYNKALNRKAMIKYDDGNLRITTFDGFDIYWKTYPQRAEIQLLAGCGTAFSISPNRILTCYHMVNAEGKDIYIKGVNGNFDKKYKAVVEKVDKQNDIAILKLIDSTIQMDSNVLSYTEDAKGSAEEVFVLGYPIANIMGDEIKLTNGLISSTSGVGGDLNTYQISAPIQPGNSGSPLFDKSGNIIGMINSGIEKADNVGYAIKFKEIQNFLKNNGYTFIAQPANTYSNLPLADKLKAFQKSIYLVEIIEVRGSKLNAKKQTKGW